jgi:hypothetical protein
MCQPAGLHRPAAGRHDDRRVLRVHDRRAAGDRLRAGDGDHRACQQGRHPDLGQPRQGREGHVHQGRQGLGRSDQELLDGPRLQQGPVPAGGSRPEQSAEDVARGAGRRQEDRRARQRHRRVLRVQRRQHRRVALHRRDVRSRRRRRHGRRQEGRLQQRHWQAGPSEPQGHAVRRQQHGRQAAAGLAGPADQRRRRQGRHVHRRAGHHHRDRHPVPGQVPGLGDGPDARAGWRGQGHPGWRRGLLLQEGALPGAGQGRSDVARVREADAGQGPVRLRARQAGEPAGGPAATAAVHRGQRRAQAGARSAQGERQRQRRGLRSSSSRRTPRRSTPCWTARCPRS